MRTTNLIHYFAHFKLDGDLGVVLTPKECYIFSFVQSASAVVRLIYFTVLIFWWWVILLSKHVLFFNFVYSV